MTKIAQVIIAIIILSFLISSGFEMHELYIKSHIKEQVREILADKGWETLESDLIKTGYGYRGEFLVRGGIFSRTTSVTIRLEATDNDNTDKKWKVKGEIPRF